MPTLLIVSEIRLFRDGIAELLAQRESVRVLESASSADDALRLARAVRPDVIVVDQALPGSLALARSLAALDPRIPVVALGVPDTDESVLAFAEAGVAGYVPTEGSVHDLVCAAEGAMRGELYCSPRLAGTIARRLAWRAATDPEPRNEPLTAREVEVVWLIADGRSNKDIATTLGIEVATVKNHVHNLLDKLKLRSRAEAAAYLSRRNGAVSSPYTLDRRVDASTVQGR